MGLGGFEVELVPAEITYEQIRLVVAYSRRAT